MDEYIEREATYADFEKCNAENPKWTPSRVKALIARQPAADVDQVVRCKNCKYWSAFMNNPDGTWIGDCEICMRFRSEDDFCSYGERKEGDDHG